MTLAQVRSTVPEIFHTQNNTNEKQTKKSQRAPKTEPYLHVVTKHLLLMSADRRRSLGVLKNMSVRSLVDLCSYEDDAQLISSVTALKAHL